uniref:Uncharacterized protein n=1 Tax=Pithovirus LCPAC201 TaxID=2506591 RepID=A0A481Z531_9VIRU|nr:MAG: hypothetical protein LCPAC201_02750 [Pithovirus LCPAC201]
MMNISVSPYPTEKGKLYLSLEDGIVYFPANGAITVIGCDINNTKIVSPIDSTDALKSLVANPAGFRVSIDDSLAREHQNNGGLKASNIIVDSGSIRHRTFEPASLTAIVSDYIVENSSSENLSLDVLPNKFQEELEPRIESMKVTAELKKMTASLEIIRLKLCVRNDDKQLGFDSRHDSKIKEIQKKINELILDIPSDFS